MAQYSTFDAFGSGGWGLGIGMVGGAGQLKEIPSPCILTPLTVFVDGFLNFSPVAPGNWAVTDVSSIEPEVSSSVAMIRTTMSKSQKRLKYQRNQLTISLCWNLNRLLCLISTHCHPLAHLLQQRDAFLEQSKTQSHSNRAGSTLYNYKSTLIIPIASCPLSMTLGKVEWIVDDLIFFWIRTHPIVDQVN